MMDISFHYPPELLQLLKDTIPRLSKSKKDMLLFFQGAGISTTFLKPYEDLLKKDRDSFKKFNVARDILTTLNELGETTLRVRREILKRVVEFDDFSVCYETDRLAAQGLVSQIQKLINTKDSFTRMQNEKDAERNKRIKQEEEIKERENKKRVSRDKVKSDLYALFGITDAHKRGKALEPVLNDLFATHEISIREAFTVKGSCGEGVIEQIDGLIELDGHLYLVEMKWWNSPIGKAEIAQPLVNVFNRGGQVRGIFISYTEYTAPAVAECRTALAGGAVVVLATLKEIVELLESGSDFKKWLKIKINAAIIDKNPLLQSNTWEMI